MICNTLVHIIRHVMIYALTDCSIRVVHPLKEFKNLGRQQDLVSYRPSARATQPK